MRNITFTNFRPAPCTKGLLVSLALLSAPVWAQVADNSDADETALEVITVVGQNTPDIGTQNNANNLGNIQKNDFVLQETQVENIRDLTRYDPGISVNEAGGRGTSRGFAIRGVEKERVSIAVDGLNNAPILRRDDRSHASSPSRSSASINEVEYENLKLVNIRKGSSSSASGSGALGGAVTMTTKDTADFFSDDDSSFSGRLKVGYTSKDKRKLISAAMAARYTGWEGFAQYTVRSGHEIRAHEDLYKKNYQVQGYFPNGRNHTFNAEDVSGAQRRVPNPLDYDSKSFLSKVGYRLNDVHYAGMVIEHTVQHYGLRDMYVDNFHSNDPEYRIFGETPTDRMLAYTPTRHYFDNHSNTRIGLEYQYRAPDSNGLIDAANARLDWRTLSITTDIRSLNCAPWPSVDPSCWPQITHDNAAGQLANKTYTDLSEKDIRFDSKLFKSLEIGKTSHQLYLHTGITASKYRVDDELQQLHIHATSNPDILDIKQDKEKIATNTITGRNFFIGIGDKINLSDRLQSNLSLRYDHHRFKSPPPTDKQIERGFMFTGSSFNNFSWDADITYQPFDNWTLAYRASSGFRVPSVIEQIGLNFNIKEYEKGNLERVRQHPLKTEKSLNQEIGIEYNSAPLKASVSYFITKYSDIIDRQSTNKALETYHNSENFTTHGIDLHLKAVPHFFWDKIPPGLELFTNAGVTKIKKRSTLADDVDLGATYSFDAIQPLRVIYGLNYHDPSEKWGASLTNTWSKAKDPDELTTDRVQGGQITTGGARFANARSKDWWTTDLTGYYNFSDDITLRAGVYNLFNHRYITWESARETAFSSEARVNTGHYTVAPGRNYLLNFEIRL